MLQAAFDDLWVAVHDCCLARLEIFAKHCYDKRAHSAVLSEIAHRDATVWIENIREVDVARIFEQIGLAGLVDSEDASPDEDHWRLQLDCLALEELENVWKDADAKGEINGPRT
jgi:hypothetical protein